MRGNQFFGDFTGTLCPLPRDFGHVDCSQLLLIDFSRCTIYVLWAWFCFVNWFSCLWSLYTFVRARVFVGIVL